VASLFCVLLLGFETFNEQTFWQLKFNFGNFFTLARGKGTLLMALGVIAS
jgi:hypothetical protein